MTYVIGRTLGFYISGRVVKAVLGSLAMIFALVFVLDVIETSRRASEIENARMSTILSISMFRTPSIVEQTLPFAVLFGSMSAFLGLSRKLELIVARAAGVSAWQFLTPVFALAVLFGILAATVFNPISADFKARCEALEAYLFEGRSSVVNDAAIRWLRQRTPDGQAILRASHSANGGEMLTGVTFFTFDLDGRFVERIEAASAALKDGFWELKDVRVLRPEREPVPYDQYRIATFLTGEQVRQRFEKPDSVPFWRLPTAIALANVAGLDANEYRLRFQTLLARPVLLLAMTMIAATVSLRFFRFGGIGLLIAGGIAAGFVLYVVTEMTEDLGAAGILDPALAAWTPALIGLLVGFAMLLNQEDG
jgi:lipopolysaccharide export system permease protein